MDLKQIIKDKTGLEYKYNSQPMKGGDILAPQGKMYKDVVSLDFKSYYPSIIRSYNLFGKQLTEFIEEQSKLKDQGDTGGNHKVVADAKLVMNSIYGYMKHFDYDKASLVTKIGRKTIRQFREFLTNHGYKVIYSHTDSVMVCDVDDVEDLERLVKHFIKDLDKAAFVKDKMKIAIEHEFRFIYFQEIDNTFLKNRYTGVTYDDRLYFNGFKPNEEELKMIDFIHSKLTQGEFVTTSKELMEYLKKYQKITDSSDSFINIELLNIIRVDVHKADF